MDILAFWDSILRQDASAIRTFFHPQAYVNWHNTGERFTLEEFIRANCEYPGQWAGKVERIVETGELVITVTHVYNRERTLSLHATSFLHIVEGKIASMDEYWGDDGPAPLWRQEMGIGKRIVE